MLPQGNGQALGNGTRVHLVCIEEKRTLGLLACQVRWPHLLLQFWKACHAFFFLQEQAFSLDMRVLG